MSEWINVKNRLPEEDGKYLIWDGFDFYINFFKDGYFLMCVFPEIRYDRIFFTHWMEIPKPLEVLNE